MSDGGKNGCLLAIIIIGLLVWLALVYHEDRSKGRVPPEAPQRMEADE